MNRITLGLLAGVVLLQSCVSSTIIKSNPTGAELYINEESVGSTPYRYSDSKIVGSRNYIRIEKDGYETFEASFSRNEEINVGALIGGFLVTVPFLWVMDYKPEHMYTLKPTQAPVVIIKESPPKSEEPVRLSKADRIRDLDKLVTEGLLTKEEFELEKQKILSEP